MADHSKEKLVRVKLKPKVVVETIKWSASINGRLFKLSSKEEAEVPDWLLERLPAHEIIAAKAAEKPKAEKPKAEAADGTKGAS